MNMMTTRISIQIHLIVEQENPKVSAEKIGQGKKKKKESRGLWFESEEMKAIPPMFDY